MKRAEVADRRTSADLPCRELLDRHLVQRLGPATLSHSLQVAEHAQSLASRFGADPRLAWIAGLLHDWAKDLPAAVYLDRAAAAGLEVYPAELDYPPLLHQRLGAYDIELEFGARLPAPVVAAVRCHTTGRDDMDALARCLLTADYTAGGRDFQGVDALRAALARDAHAGFRAVLAFKRRWVQTLGRQEHPWALRAYSRWL